MLSAFIRLKNSSICPEKIRTPLVLHSSATVFVVKYLYNLPKLVGKSEIQFDTGEMSVQPLFW